MTKPASGKLQTFCLIATGGHMWMDYYDLLPPLIRARLRQSRFNLCPACLITEVLPRVSKRHDRERRLMIAIDVMERTVEDFKRLGQLT